MVIYKHEYCLVKDNIDIKTYKVNVEEKPKTYIVVGKNVGVYESRISKEDIGKLSGTYTRTMFTLTPDITKFLKAVIDRVELHIKYTKEDLEKSMSEKFALLELLEEHEEQECEDI